MSMRIRMQADDFFNAYQVLDESNAAFFIQIQQTGGVPQSNKKAFGTFPTTSPSIVCLAFAVELYIKDLHFALKGEAPRGHNIFELYIQLPKQIKREIFSHKSISENPATTLTPVFVRKRYTGRRNAYHGFLHQMKAISKIFEKWRYSYESTTLQYEESFAIAFLEAVKSVADTRRGQSST